MSQSNSTTSPQSGAGEVASLADIDVVVHHDDQGRRVRSLLRHGCPAIPRQKRPDALKKVERAGANPQHPVKGHELAATI